MQGIPEDKEENKKNKLIIKSFLPQHSKGEHQNREDIIIVLIKSVIEAENNNAKMFIIQSSIFSLMRKIELKMLLCEIIERGRMKISLRLRTNTNLI